MFGMYSTLRIHIKICLPLFVSIIYSWLFIIYHCFLSFICNHQQKYSLQLEHIEWLVHQ